HDWNALNNREKRGLFGSRVLNTTRIDDPTKTPMQRDRIVTGLLPLLWSNDYGGVTAALRTRSTYLGRFDKNLALASYGFDARATRRYGWYVKYGNPVTHPTPRTEASAATWSVEGRTGIALHADRSLR